ncbi:tRNA (adenosine(37)-N6)-dimethylallyltransferase MiaA [Martelella mediterranea]|uniref:tRNA (adenosine(37)-N6)-dimethylallyltransferase MiaA n=1 Tax=Martelella mediterranea TaxID=293089 RepID=UPI001E2E6D4F|nr:tRNA (adenosine(37)-N6)-dimethylallyltransferase MiaA [Martelella mediterranea]MCD1635239.1 tRNA (adenosine(37)-N6)-dimethylallyltransferase MiaA [Martelella mediterranea]
MANSSGEHWRAVLITGPTASGKSAYAIARAEAAGGVVINADSMQVYDTLRVLTARPSVDDMQGIPHYLYGHVPAGDEYSTGAWLRDMEALLKQFAGEGRMPVIVGGTGLYFKALTEGLAAMPPVPADIRARWRQALAEEGAVALHSRLAECDPAMAARLQPSDGQRIVRALEVFEACGRSIADFQAENPPPLIDAANADKIVVLPERSVLHDRINRRFETMLEAGAVEEIEALLALGLDPAAPVMRAIGVKEIAAMLSGAISRDEVIEKASAATRQYAKRQMTWFRNQMGPEWKRLDPAKG